MPDRNHALDRKALENIEMKAAPDLRLHLETLSDEIDLLRQNSLLSESALSRFATDRGVDVVGVGPFYKRGWLPSDGIDSQGEPRFHPFRIYALHRIVQACKIPIGPSVSLNQEIMLQLVRDHVPNVDRVAGIAGEANRFTDLAILLEPVYWPGIVGCFRHSVFQTEDDYEVALRQYRAKILDLVRTLDSKNWRTMHESLRLNARRTDMNLELYLLLRVSRWSLREKLTGRVATALWIRHIAEVVRRAFEEAHHENWPEEDEGSWPRTPVRARTFGSERPIDDEPRTKSCLASRVCPELS